MCRETLIGCEKMQYIFCVCINEIIMDHIWDTLHPILIDLNGPAVCARVPTAPLSHSLTSRTVITR